MRVLLFGGAGYIGTHVSMAFLERGDKVGIYDNLSSGLRSNVSPEAEFYEGDILDLLGYLRDFSAGGGFSSLDAGAGKGASGRHGGQGQPPAADPWDGPFSEN